MIPVSILVLALVQTPAPQPAPPADGLLTGRVIDGATGRPVVGVTVTLALRAAPNTPPAPRDSTPPPPRVLVDSAGRFVFTGLKPGSYDVTATRRGFVSGELGKLRPDGLRMALVLGPSERRTDLTLRVWKHASIAGAVLDDMNEPLVGVEVHALRREFVAGDVRLVRSSGATTDDRGRYRVGSLLPGDYLVVVPSTQTASSLVQPPPGADGRLAVYPATYYPGTPDVLNGALVGVATGESKSIPPIRVRPVPAARMSGVLTGPDGPAALVPLVLVPQIADAFASEYGFEAASTTTDAAGAFTFPAVAPGTFRLRASTQPAAPTPPNSGGGGGGGGGATPSPSSGPSYWLTETITVSGRDITVAFTLKPTFRVGGRLVFDGTRPRPDQVRDVLAFAAADGRQINRLRGRDLGSSDGRFEIQGVSGGRYVLAPWILPSGWFVKSVMVRGQEAVDAPVDLDDDISDVVVTLTDRPTSLKGNVRTSAGSLDADADVIVFPANPQRWSGFSQSPLRIRNVRTDANGAYALTGLPPGDYFVAAISDAAAGGWQGAKFLESLSRQATRVTLTEGAPLTLDLKRVEIK